MHCEHNVLSFSSIVDFFLRIGKHRIFKKSEHCLPPIGTVLKKKWFLQFDNGHSGTILSSTDRDIGHKLCHWAILAQHMRSLFLLGHVT